jgi:hypothetical protein
VGLPSYVVNFDELAELLKDYLEKGIDVDIGGVTLDSSGIENLLQQISNKIQGVDYTNLVNALNALGANLNNIGGNLGISGTQKIYGKALEILPITDQLQYTISFDVPSTGRLTGITYSLSSWNWEDNWDLIVGENKIFTGVRTKEYGEHKFFNVFYPVTGGQKIQFVFNNVSESSKILWVDFDILED